KEESELLEWEALASIAEGLDKRCKKIEQQLRRQKLEGIAHVLRRLREPLRNSLSSTDSVRAELRAFDERILSFEQAVTTLPRLKGLLSDRGLAIDEIFNQFQPSGDQLT